jgi:hypothetical protein
MAEIAILRRVQEDRARERRRARRAHRERKHMKIALALAAMGGFVLYIGLQPLLRGDDTTSAWPDEAIGI